MIKLNSPKGLGDAIYLRAIVLHLLARGETVKIFTPWGEVFSDLPVIIAAADEFSDDDDLHHAMACLHCRVPAIMSLGRFRLTCLQARITEPVDLKIDWKVRNAALVSHVRNQANGRAILLYQPQKISKNSDQELTRPRRDSFDHQVGNLDSFFRIKIGGPTFVSDTGLPCELDLFGKTSVSDVFDIATTSNLIFGEASCFLPSLAEALDKPFVCMFSRRAMEAVSRKRVWSMRPEFLIHKNSLATVVFDDEP